jgi:hypothetical protein
MGKRLHSDGVVWQPARSRLQLPVIALCVAALVALIGYMNAGVYDEPLSAAPRTPVSEMPVLKTAVRDATYSVEPRSAPLPRKAAAPRRAPSPRGEVREASVNDTH